MSGHGHVTPNPNGSLARCGGPAVCPVCALEFARLHYKPQSENEVEGRYLQEPAHIMQFFEFENLPPEAGELPRLYGLLAQAITDTLPRNPERVLALRHLLDSLTNAKRALIAKGGP